MNARNIAALAVTTSLLTFIAQSSNAADGPLAHFAGNWSGSGKITVKDGASERIRCRSTNTSSGNSLGLSLRCASDSYKFELASDISYDGGNISGSWNETTRGVIGSLSGKASGTNIQATASAIGFTAGLSIRSTGPNMGVTISSPGSEISEVAVSLTRGR
jgi:hypothetical protein